MKTTTCLMHWQLRQAQPAELEQLMHGDMPDGGAWIDAGQGIQVQEALLQAGQLPDEVRVGRTEACAWVAEEDWLYRCHFPAEGGARRIRLCFGGIDTVADVFLNRRHIAFHDDMYLPLTLDVTEALAEDNCLAVYFHSPNRVVRERLAALPEDMRARMENLSVLRKCSQDFGDFGGVTLTTVGLFEDVTLTAIHSGSVDDVAIRTRFNPWRTRAQLSVETTGLAYAPGMTLRTELLSPDGTLAAVHEHPVSDQAGSYHCHADLTVEQPQLWWPKNYGEQPLYRLIVTLGSSGRIIDQTERTLGLRQLEKTGDMRFRVNGREIKLWGGNLCALEGLTHRWSEERCGELMLRLCNANMNLLRLWGGGAPYGDSFYDICDRAGILVYQDFFLHWAYYTEDADAHRKYEAEARYTVRRLRHHACILLWSGGNETWMHNEENSYEKVELSYTPFLEDFARAAREEDPDRFYLPSSPSGGDYPSDPAEGDGHPLYYTYRHAVEKFPVFASESARTSIGPWRSLRRFMSDEELWPCGYVNQVTYRSPHPTKEKYFAADEKFFVPVWKRVPTPPAWNRWKARFFAGESAAIERFYEADCAQELVYRYNAAFAEFMQTYSEGVRRGKPHDDLEGKRRVNGYMLWKINDSWPQLHCTLVDYFMETTIPYYQVKRSYAPVLLSFEDADHLLLWGVNDTAEAVTGTLRIAGFSMANNRVMAEYTLPVRLRPGEAKVLTDLDPICPIIREWIVYASLTDDEGHELARKDTFIEAERYLTFPEARLTLREDAGSLIVTTDRVARCVELGGSMDGEGFGWLFDDNFFNLLPFEEKRVAILRRGEGDVLYAKAHYSPFVTTLPWKEA